jgi:hypothetical protein
LKVVCPVKPGNIIISIKLMERIDLRISWGAQ